MTVSRLQALMQPAIIWKSLPLVAALAVSCFLTYQFNASLRQGHVMVEHSMSALTAIDRVLSLLQDAETGQRGFVITGEEAYLAPYGKAKGEVEAALRDLDALVGKNPQQHQAVEEMRDIASRKLDELSRVIDVRRKSGLQAASTLVSADRGKSEMDDLRRVVAATKEREKAILDEKQDAVDEKNGIIVWVSLGALLISLVGRAASTLIRMPAQFGRRPDPAE